MPFLLVKKQAENRLQYKHTPFCAKFNLRMLKCRFSQMYTAFFLWAG